MIQSNFEELDKYKATKATPYKYITYISEYKEGYKNLAILSMEDSTELAVRYNAFYDELFKASVAAFTHVVFQSIKERKIEDTIEFAHAAHIDIEKLESILAELKFKNVLKAPEISILLGDILMNLYAIATRCGTPINLAILAKIKRLYEEEQQIQRTENSNSNSVGLHDKYGNPITRCPSPEVECPTPCVEGTRDVIVADMGKRTECTYCGAYYIHR